MNSEQQEELEVLQSIFPDTFSGITAPLLPTLNLRVCSDIFFATRMAVKDRRRHDHNPFECDPPGGLSQRGAGN